MLCASGEAEDEIMGTNAELYGQDFYAWTQEQAALLREGKWHALDCEHLIEEIEDLDGLVTA